MIQKPTTPAPAAPATPAPAPACDSANFTDEITRFAESIDSLLLSLPSVMVAISIRGTGQQTELNAFLQKHATGQHTDGDNIRFTLSGEHLAIARRMQRALQNNQTAFRLIHRSFLTSLMSQYDAYLGRLLRLTYLVNPERLNSSEKQITFKELVQFASLEEARERLIEREVDSVIRQSHEDQLAWLKANLGIDAAAFIPELPNFIEIAQRRHLFVHCDGVVSPLYIKNCTAAGVKLDPGIVTGHQLEVSKDYLESAFEQVYAVGLKVGFAVWLRLLKSDINKAADCLNALALDLICNKRYLLAINLLEYALSGKQKTTSDRILRFLVLNLAQAYRWAGNQAQCKKVLDGYDWSACSAPISFGFAALTDDFKEACRLMKSLPHDKDFKKEFYRDWPILRELRKQTIFQTAYKELYGEDFQVAELVSPNAERPSPPPNPPLASAAAAPQKS